MNCGFILLISEIAYFYDSLVRTKFAFGSDSTP